MQRQNKKYQQIIRVNQNIANDIKLTCPQEVHKLIEIVSSQTSYEFIVEAIMKRRFNSYWFGSMRPYKTVMQSNNERYKENILSQKKRIDNNVQSSFNNSRLRKTRNTLLDEHILRTYPYDSAGKTNIYNSYAQETLSWNGYKKDLRLKYARKIYKKLDLQKIDFETLILQAFECIESFLLKDTLSYNDILSIIYLEKGIEYSLNTLLVDLGLPPAKLSLTSLRKRSVTKFNTICYSCGEKILKRNATHYCSKKVNRSCQNHRRHQKRFKSEVDAVIKSKNKCAQCGKFSCHDFIIKVNGIVQQFCSNGCSKAYQSRSYYRNKNGSSF